MYRILKDIFIALNIFTRKKSNDWKQVSIQFKKIVIEQQRKPED